MVRLWHSHRLHLGRRILAGRDTLMHSCQAELTKLGSVRHTVEEQRLFLVDLSQRFRRVCLNAIQYFCDEGLSTSAQEKRLRAVVRNLEMNFKNSIYEKGSEWTIVLDEALDLTEQTREAAVDQIKSRM